MPGSRRRGRAQRPAPPPPGDAHGEPGLPGLGLRDAEPDAAHPLPLREHPDAAPVRLNRRGRAVLVLLVLAVVGAVLAGGGLLAARLIGRPAPDYRGPGAGRVVVQVHDGDTATDIGQALATKGVVASVAAFRKAAGADPRAAAIQPGYYVLHARMSARQALALLLDPASRLRTRVSVPEGLSLRTLLPTLADNTNVPLADLQAAAARPAELGLPDYARGQVEGFLFPTSYDVSPDSTAVQLLHQMTARFAATADELHLVAGAAKLGYTPLQVVTIASIIERESAAPQDAPRVAEVFYNRLRAGLPLGSEFTVRYAGGDPASPYNTYTHKGFPPGPYDSPGRNTLLAALHPAAGDALYFVTLPREGTQFVRTEPEFAQLVTRCRVEGGCR